jgi:hypothetical protein
VAAITGYSPGEAQGKSFLRFVSAEYRETAKAIWNNVSSGAPDHICEPVDMTLLTKTGGSEDVVLNVSTYGGGGKAGDGGEGGGKGGKGQASQPVGIMLMMSVCSQRIGNKYRLLTDSALEVLAWIDGSGTYGSVTLARRTADNQVVAIKKLEGGEGGADGGGVDAGARPRLDGKQSKLDLPARRKLETETQLLGRMAHAHIIKLFDHFYEGGAFFVVMEYADGRNLREKVEAQGGKFFP